MIWHSHSTDDVLKELNTDGRTGLSEAAALQRLEEYGENDTRADKHSADKDLRRPLCAALAVAAVVSSVLAFYDHAVNAAPWQWQETLALLLLLPATVLPDTILRRRAQKAQQQHRKNTALCHTAYRDGQAVAVPTHELVPGDILRLKAGDVAPADCRLLQADGLQCDESALTGDVTLTIKDAETLFADITPLAQRTNMLYAGSRIVCGSGTAVVVATGKQSELGHLAALTDQDNADRPTTQKTAATLLPPISIAVLILSLLLGIGVLLRSGSLPAAVTTALTVAVAVIPAGLTAIVPTAWAYFVQSDETDGAVVKHPAAAEALADATVLCKSEERSAPTPVMGLAYAGRKVTVLTDEAPDKHLQLLLRLASLSAEESDPEEAPLLHYTRQTAADRELLQQDMPCHSRIVTSQYAVSVHHAGDKAVVIAKGDPKAIFSLCTRGHVAEAADALPALQSDAHRLWAVAYRILDTIPTESEPPGELTLAGLYSTVIRAAQQAHPRQIAGLRNVPFDGDKCATVEQLRRQGETVAVVADSEAELPALQAAHVRIAMGPRCPLSVSDAADVTTDTDDALESAIFACRRAVQNSRRAALYLLAACAAVLLTTAVAVIGSGTLSPLLLLYVSILSGSVLTPLLARAHNPKDTAPKRREPRVTLPILLTGLSPAVCACAAYLIGHFTADGVTMAFIALGVGLPLLAASLHTRLPVYRTSPRHVWPLLTACAAAIALTLCILWIPQLRELLSLAAINAGATVGAIGLSLIPTIVSELTKQLTKN